MKAIVVYFSLEGNSKYVADKVSKDLGADLLRLEPIKEYPHGNISKFFWGGKSVLLGETPNLVSYDFVVSEYDVIILGTPIWAGSFAPPIQTFITANDLGNKKIALFACHGGGGADKCFNKIKNELPSNKIVALLDLANPMKKEQPENEAKIKDFCDAIRNS
ncbi:MAG: flavodoxin family protein [Lachnotalea sp.]